MEIYRKLRDALIVFKDKISLTTVHLWILEHLLW
jgi:hypothetical protein